MVCPNQFRLSPSLRLIGLSSRVLQDFAYLTDRRSERMEDAAKLGTCVGQKSQHSRIACPRKPSFCSPHPVIYTRNADDTSEAQIAIPD